jgi:hypothetical protein
LRDIGRHDYLSDLWLKLPGKTRSFPADFLWINVGMFGFLSRIVCPQMFLTCREKLYPGFTHFHPPTKRVTLSTVSFVKNPSKPCFSRLASGTTKVLPAILYGFVNHLLWKSPGKIPFFSQNPIPTVLSPFLTG